MMRNEKRIRLTWGSGYSFRATLAGFNFGGQGILSLLLYAAVLTAVPGVTRGATVTGRVTYILDAHQHGKAPEGANLVVWLEPISRPQIDEAEARLKTLPHHFQLLQFRKTFNPHFLVVPVGSIVDFPNKDPFFHNVFSLFDGKRFDLGLYEAGTTRGVRFDRAGVSFIFCNIHPQMSAVIIAMKTPYYAVSDKSGGVEIQDVPAGQYRMEVWSERALPETLKSLQREVMISEGASSLGTIAVKETRDLLAGHKNKYGADYDSTGPSTPVYQ
jgi:plastocyanin